MRGGSERDPTRNVDFSDSAKPAISGAGINALNSQEQ
jgi:hypothetical protein